MPVPNLTLATIQRHVTDNSYDRGNDYWRSGAVVSLTQRQHRLEAEVEGNDPTPYRVRLDFDGGGITRAVCTCPYSFEGWCKHIVAVLLTCIHQPEQVEQRPTLAQLLDRLDLVQTQGLVQSLVDDNPALVEAVDLYVNGLRLSQPMLSSASTPYTSAKASSRQRQTSIDPVPFKRQVKAVLREALSNWDDGRDDDDIACEIGELVDSALEFLAQGDVDNAAIALQAITEGCIENWSGIEDYIGMSPLDFDLDFDSAWAELILSDDWTEDEAAAWQEKFEVWQDQLASFAMALEALRQGWDYPPLVRVLQGEIGEQGAWSGEAPGWASEFSQIRLRILARQERYEEYLRLAEAEGQVQAYLTMLERTDELMAVAPKLMGTLTEAKALAAILRSQDELESALQIALQGLRFEDNNPYIASEFGVWTSDLAEGLGDRTAALEARTLAFKAQSSFKDYRKLEELAGTDWPEVKTELLQHLRTTDYFMSCQAQVDVFLHEGLLKDAIAAVSKRRSYNGQLILRVMDAVVESHSQWVIDNARPRAESIMDEGKAKYYHHAVDWLKRVKAGYRALGKDADWARYQQRLVNAHGRKRKLMGLMEQARL